MVYLTTLSVAQTIQRQTAGLLVNTQLEGMWKEAVAGIFEELSRHLSGGTMKHQEKTQAG
jgi:hypothetical protein